jgi:hypothetical protein
MLRRLPTVVVLAILSAGCGGQSYKTAPVSGKVTLNGKPLADAAVMFQPIASGSISAGPGSEGRTDAEGRYTLSIIGTKKQGAVLGKHKVRITMFEKDDPADDKPKRTKRLPPQYNRKTILEFEVTAGGSDSADFSLKEP